MLLRHEAFPALCWRGPHLPAPLLNMLLSITFTACCCTAVCWCPSEFKVNPGATLHLWTTNTDAWTTLTAHSNPDGTYRWGRG